MSSPQRISDNNIERFQAFSSTDKPEEQSPCAHEVALGCFKAMTANEKEDSKICKSTVIIKLPTSLWETANALGIDLFDRPPSVDFRNSYFAGWGLWSSVQSFIKMDIRKLGEPHADQDPA